MHTIQKVRKRLSKGERAGGPHGFVFCFSLCGDQTCELEEPLKVADGRGQIQIRLTGKGKAFKKKKVFIHIPQGLNARQHQCLDAFVLCRSCKRIPQRPHCSAGGKQDQYIGKGQRIIRAAVGL